MSKTLQIAAIVVILAVAVVVYFVRRPGMQSFTARSDFTVPLQCAACKTQFNATVDAADEPPYKCKACGAESAWRARMCRKCNEVFVPPVAGDPPLPPAIASCPKCGSQATGAAPPYPEK